MSGLKKRSYTLGELAELTKGQVLGDEHIVLNSVATLSGAHPNQISFLTNPKYKAQLSTTKAGAVIVSPKLAADVTTAALLTENPHAVFAKIAQLFDSTPDVSIGVADTAIIAPSANLGSNVSLGPNVVIEDNVVIGDNVQIGANTVVRRGTKIGKDSIVYPNVTLYHDVVLGKRTVVQSQTVIGSNGFGYANDAGHWLPIPQTGTVKIGDDTEIGAGCTIDRGAIGDTLIGKNVIIDNQVHIAHNCEIGDHSCLCGAVGIAGSTKLGKYVIVGGGVGISGHLAICDNVQITGYTMVLQDITEAGVYSSGQPALPNRDWHRSMVRLKQLDEMAKRLNILEKRLSK